MTDDFEYIYYLPLEVRKAINPAASFTVQVTGVGLSTYKPSESALTDIKEIVDQEKELEGYLVTSTSNAGRKPLKERLLEAKALFDSELITEGEYKDMRKNILKTVN